MSGADGDGAPGEGARARRPDADEADPERPGGEADGAPAAAGPAEGDARPRPRGALRGLRGLDLSRVLAGPWATQTLADLGAEVWKVEPPGAGDDTRAWGPAYVTDDRGREAGSAYFTSANRGKRSLAIDVAHPEGRALVRALAQRADVLVENFKVGGLARHGLGWDDLRALNPRLVYCSITGFGQDGPRAAQPGYDALIQGMGGLMSVTGEPDGEPDGEPVKAGVALADVMTGLYATVAILAALRHRDATGEGQRIDLALLDVQPATIANQARERARHGDRVGAARQGAPEHRAPPALRGRGWAPDPGGRQRRAVRAVLRGGGPARDREGPAPRHQSRVGAAPRDAGAAAGRARHCRPGGVVARPARRGGRAGGTRQRPRGGVRGPPGDPPRHGHAGEHARRRDDGRRGLAPAAVGDTRGGGCRAPALGQDTAAVLGEALGIAPKRFTALRDTGAAGGPDEG